jgi:hypothetical protein
MELKSARRKTPLLDVTEALIDRLADTTMIQTQMKKVLLEDITYRSSIGLDRYGTRLKTHNGRDSLIDLYEELLDAYFYAMQHELENSSAMTEVIIEIVEEALSSCLTLLAARESSGFLKKYRPMNSQLEGNHAT